MPIVDISLLEGRDAARKARLIREVTDAVERVLGVPRETVRVLLREVPPEHWGVGGEAKASAPARPKAKRRARP